MAAARWDLERFLEAAMPVLPLARGVPLADALRALTLADVWAAFLDASLVGCPVVTAGGPRGPWARGRARDGGPGPMAAALWDQGPPLPPSPGA